MHPAIVGAAKSKTMWAAIALGLISELWPVIQPLWLQVLPLLHLDPTTVQIIGGAAATLMAVLRIITSQSLTDKGLDPPLPPPVIQPVTSSEQAK